MKNVPTGLTSAFKTICGQQPTRSDAENWTTAVDWFNKKHRTSGKWKPVYALPNSVPEKSNVNTTKLYTEMLAQADEIASLRCILVDRDAQIAAMEVRIAQVHQLEQQYKSQIANIQRELTIATNRLKRLEVDA